MARVRKKLSGASRHRGVKSDDGLSLLKRLRQAWGALPFLGCRPAARTAMHADKDQIDCCKDRMIVSPFLRGGTKRTPHSARLSLCPLSDAPNLCMFTRRRFGPTEPEMLCTTSSRAHLSLEPEAETVRGRGDRTEGEMNKTRKQRKPNHQEHGAGQERAAATRWNESASRGAGEKEREGTLVCITRRRSDVDVCYLFDDDDVYLIYY